MQTSKNQFSIKNLVQQGIEDKIIIPGEGVESYIKKIKETDEKKANLLEVLIDAEKRAKKGKNPKLTGTIDGEKILDPKKYLELVKKQFGSSNLEKDQLMKEYSNSIEKTFKHELVKSVISEQAGNLTQRHFDDESNYEIMGFLMSFSKAIMPEIIKQKFDITQLGKPIEKTDIVKDFIDPLDKMHLNSPEIKKITMSFIEEMNKRFPGTPSGGLVEYGFSKIVRHVCLVFNCYVNDMDPEILRSSPEETYKSMMKLAEAMAKKGKMPLMVDPSGDPKKTAEAIVKHIKGKDDILNKNLN